MLNSFVRGYQTLRNLEMILFETSRMTENAMIWTLDKKLETLSKNSGLHLCPIFIDHLVGAHHIERGTAHKSLPNASTSRPA